MLVAASVRLALPEVVLLPGVSRRVKAVAVELDGQLSFRPAAVDVVAAGRPVGPRQRKAGLAQQLQEPLLELAEDHVRVAADDAAELGGARSSRPLRQRGLDPPRRGPEADAGLVAGPAEILLRQIARDVDERAGHSHHGNPLPDGGLDLFRSARLDPFDPARPRRCHLGRRRRALEQAEQVGGGEATQHGPFAASLYRCHVAGLHARRVVADAVDARVRADQRPDL